MAARTVQTARSGLLQIATTSPSGQPAAVTLNDRKSVLVLAPDEARTVALRLIEAAAKAERGEDSSWP